MILVFEVVFASIAFILTTLGFFTWKAIRRLGVGTAFWIPVCLSGVSFLFGSVIGILLESGFPLSTQMVEIMHISRLLALSFLVVGIFSYSRRVKASLVEEFTIPEHVPRDPLVVEVPVEDIVEPTPTVHKKGAQESTMRKSSDEAAAVECRHHMGYLKTLPRAAPIPDECLGCDKVIECKHSVMKSLTTPPSGQ